MKIRPKLTFTYLVISLVALIVTSAISYNIAKKSLTEKVLNQLESVATIQKNRLESIIEQNLERLNLISSRTQLRLSLEEYIGDPKEEYQNKINLILRDVRSSIASLRDVSVLTLNGAIMASTDSASIGTNHSGEAYFLRGKKKGCADIFFFNEDKKLSAYLAGPLYLENKLLGVIVVESDVENIISLVEDYTGLGKTGEMLLAKRAENNDALLLMPLRFDKEAALTRTISHKELQDPIIQALSGKVQFLTDALDYRGETVLAVTQYISKTHWGVVVKIDKTEAFAPVFQLYNLLTLIIVISSLIVILVSYFSARSITRPIIDLRNVVSKISEGDLSQRVEMISKDEIGVSALAINKMAESLIEAKIGLENKVKERTAELADANTELKSVNMKLLESFDELKMLQDKLIQAEKLSALGRFTAEVAHQIRNPLTVVGGFAKRLKTHLEVGTKEMSYASLIESESQRLERILKDVLDFTKEEKYDLYYLDIGDVILELLELFHNVCNEKSIVIKTQVNQNLPKILMDKNYVMQAINILFDNAVDAMPEGGTLTIKGRMEQFCKADYVVVDIIDSGGGISDDHITKLIEPFFSSKITGGHGTGLSLAICAKIMEKHGGRIRVSSIPGKGSIFSLLFPYQSEDDSSKMQCWEYHNCGVDTKEGTSERDCPAYPHYGRICWALAGTYSEGKIQCGIAQKIGNCKRCEFYNSVVSKKDI